MNRALASSAEPNAHVENPDHSGTGFLTHRSMIITKFATIRASYLRQSARTKKTQNAD